MSQRERLQELIKHALKSPLFRGKLGHLSQKAIVDLQDIPLMTVEELVAEKIKTGDPYSSRWCRRNKPEVVFQLEYDTESALYLALDRALLRSYAEALRRCWSILGLRAGDRVAIFDYGTSPLSYLASSAFTPYLRPGAADSLGCLPVCNDGVSSMARRAIDIVKFVRPRVLFLRTDCLEPFALEVEGELGELNEYTEALVAAENEGVLPAPDREAYERRLRIPVYRLLRADAALFLSAECPECKLFHSSPDLYCVESVGSVPGPLAITNWFAKSYPTLRYLSQANGSVRGRGCPRGPEDQRIAA